MRYPAHSLIIRCIVMPQTLAKLYPAHLQTLQQHWNTALTAAGCEHALIAAGAPHGIFLDDMDYPFKVNPHFKHWLPVTDNPHCFLLYTPGKKPTVFFYQPVDFWHKPADAPQDFWVQYFNLHLLTTPDELRKHLPAKLDRCAFVGEWHALFADWGLNAQCANPAALIDYLHYHRAWKTPYELECMRRATARGVAAHRAAERAFRDGGSEYAIHLAFLAAAQHNEHELPYGNIIALNEHGSVLHYQHQQRQTPAARHSFLIDAGAQFHGYASDITRTYSAQDDEFQQLINALDAAQQQLCAQVKPGLDYKALQLASHHAIGSLLHDFGFIKPDGAAAVEQGLTRYFYPHGVGHYLGLQVHDVGGFAADAKGGTIPRPDNHPFLRLTRVVEENQVFTVEPGLYFIAPLLEELRASPLAAQVNWQKVDAFRRYGGIRIEDNVIVTANGHENMTRAAFEENPL